MEQGTSIKIILDLVDIVVTLVICCFRKISHIVIVQLLFRPYLF